MKNGKKKVAIIITLVVIAIAITIGVVIGTKTAAEKEAVLYFLDDLEETSFNNQGAQPDKGTVKRFEEISQSKYIKPQVLTIINEASNINREESLDRRIAISDAVTIVGNLSVLGYNDSEVDKALSELICSELKYYDENSINYDYYSLMHDLNNAGFCNEEVKAVFLESLCNRREAALSNDAERMADYFNYARDLGEGFYCDTVDVFPYDDIVACLEKYGEPIIYAEGMGGYYDGLEDQFENESYWVDPLARTKVKRGEVGTYRYTKENTLLGDFRIEKTSEYWYDTPKSDPNNSESESVHFRETVWLDYDALPTFLSIARKGTGLYIPDGPLFVVEKDMITFYWRAVLYSIAYS